MRLRQIARYTSERSKAATAICSKLAPKQEKLDFRVGFLQSWVLFTNRFSVQKHQDRCFERLVRGERGFAMAYILSQDLGFTARTAEDLERQKRKRNEYVEYLESVRDRLPE